MRYLVIIICVFTCVVFAIDKDELYTTMINETQSYTPYDSAGLDSFITVWMEENAIPGLSACFVKGDEVVWSDYSGLANIEQNREVNDSTIFITASISKTITATALMQLWEQGEFELDSDVNSYLPDSLAISNPFYPEVPITFWQLLTHTPRVLKAEVFGII